MTERPTTELELIRWLVGDSADMRELRRVVLRIAPTTVPVWIEGETGVGKEQVALALHAASGVRGALVAFNVCALSDSMFEDALFGHVRGAFTGAHTDSQGYIGEADGGTLFLDEIGGLSLSSQAKLLRAIETGRYRRVGGREDRVSEFRVIAASNEPFERLVHEGRFRADLGYRLRGIAIHVPPLRARAEDIGALTAHLIAQRKDGQDWHVEATALRWLEKQQWRGNVRELRQLLACAQVLAHRTVIDERVLRSAQAMRGASGTESRSAPFVDDGERGSLLAKLVAARWNTSVVAKDLGVDRTTVYRRMRRLGIAPPRSEKGPPHARTVAWHLPHGEARSGP